MQSRTHLFSGGRRRGLTSKVDYMDFSSPLTYRHHHTTLDRPHSSIVSKLWHWITIQPSDPPSFNIYLLTIQNSMGTVSYSQFNTNTPSTPSVGYIMTSPPDPAKSSPTGPTALERFFEPSTFTELFSFYSTASHQRRP
jgi:hypothetical protein